MGEGTGHAAGAGRLTAGDPLRAIAALSVLVFHAAVAVTITGGLVALDAYGEAGRLLFSLDTGLVVFFVLSGYLLSRPFARALVLGGPVRTDGYLRRRLARILPAYLVVLAATVVIEGRAGSPASDALVLGTLTQAWFDTKLEIQLIQGWTLSVELAFYLALPVAALVAARLARRLASPGARAGALIGLVALVAALSLGWLSTLEGVEERQLPPAHLWAFAPGIVLALLEPLDVGRRLPRWTPGALLLAGLAAGVALLAISRLREDARTPLTAVVAAAPLASALVLQWQGRPAPRLLDTRVMAWLGERSYGIYLWHWLVMLQLMPLVEDLRPWPAFTLLTGLAVPLTVACAALSWRFVERPAIRWARRPRPGPGRELSRTPAPAPRGAPALVGTPET